MLKWLIRNRLAAFEKKLDYDMSYVRALLDADTAAFMAYTKVMKMNAYRKGVPIEPWYAAKSVSVLSEDCGPCTQLGVTIALQAGMRPEQIHAVLRNDEPAMSDDVRLAVRFARMSLAHAPEADELREEVVRRWGQRGLISLAFAITAGRIFPTVKYALGYGKTCQRVRVGDTTIVPVHAHSAA